MEDEPNLGDAGSKVIVNVNKEQVLMEDTK